MVHSSFSRQVIFEGKELSKALPLQATVDLFLLTLPQKTIREPGKEIKIKSLESTKWAPLW